jgi:Ser/Thr protein kinase RdoA (MazF antagonist)
MGIADWPPITTEELRRLARHAPCLGAAPSVLWRSPRPFSAAARVGGRDGEVFVKRHDARVRKASAVLEEHAFLAHLHTRGAAVPRVLPLVGADGQPTTALELSGAVYELHSLAPGVDLYGDAHSWSPVRSVAHAAALGAALAALHRAAEGYTAPARAPRPLMGGFDVAGAADAAQGLDGYLARRPALAAYLDRPPAAAVGPVPGRAPIVQAIAPWLERLQPWRAQLPPLWVHNDLHASNAFWSEAGAAAQVRCVVDFGLCNLGCAMADLAIALERNTIAWLEAGGELGRPDLARALVRGYQAVRPLGAAERAALPLLLPLCQVEFALSELDYFVNVVQEWGNAALAHPAFLLGHIAWFGTANGRAYLDALSLELGF